MERQAAWRRRSAQISYRRAAGAQRPTLLSENRDRKHTRGGTRLGVDVADVDAALRVEEEHVVVALRDDAHVELLVLNEHTHHAM